MSIVPWGCALGDAPSAILPVATEVDLAPSDDSVDTNTVIITGAGTIASFGPAPLVSLGIALDGDGNPILDADLQPIPLPPTIPIGVTKKVLFEPDGGSAIVLTNSATLALLGNVDRTIANKSIGIYACDSLDNWFEQSFVDTTTGGGGGGGGTSNPTTLVLHATRSTDWNPTANTWLNYRFNVIVVDTQSGYTTVSPWRWTAAVAGVYLVDCQVNVNSQSGTGGLAIGKNGNYGSSAIEGHGHVNGAMTSNTLQGAFYMNVGDTLEIDGYSSSASFVGGGSFFKIWLINSGAQGPVGPQGPQGNPGVTGPAGPQGAQGNTGSTGATGSQGPPGNTGSQGPAGVQGPAGTPGAAGAAGAPGQGVPVGGATGTVLAKNSATDYDTHWVPQSGGIADAPSDTHNYARNNAAWNNIDTVFAAIASPTFTGDPKAPTPATSDNDTSIATTQFVKAAIAAGGGGGTINANIALEVSLNANQTGLTALAWNLCKYDTKVTDLQSAYSTSTGLFTPTIAGVYAVTATVGMPSSTTSQIGIAIVKNGSLTSAESQATKYASANVATPLSISALIFCNGTTDTISVQGFTPTGGTAFNSTTNAGGAVNMIATLLQTGPAGPPGATGPAGPAIAANIALEVTQNVNSSVQSTGWHTNQWYKTVTTDTQGGFNTATGVYTPTQAGLYLVTATLGAGQNSNDVLGIAIVKNGSRTNAESQGDLYSGGAGGAGPGVLAKSALIFCNGTTDTISVQGDVGASTTGIFYSSANVGMWVGMVATLLQTGPPGPQGVAGPQGPIGNTGPTGGTGPQGAQGAGYQATSTTSLTIGTGAQTFTTQAGLAYTVGARARLSSTASPAANFMEGVVTAYSGTSMTIGVDTTNGSGALAAWDLNIAGQPGPTPGITAQAPTVQKIITAGAFTYTPSAGVKWIRIKAAASGGGGSSTAGAANGGTAGNLTMLVGGVLALTLGGGVGGASINGGSGGAVTLGTVPSNWQILFSASGGWGHDGTTMGPYGMGGGGGTNMFGGDGGGGGQSAGNPGQAGTGAGGGGGGWGGNSQQAQGSGGGAGACAEILIGTPTVITGTLGANGAGTSAGGQYNGNAGGLGGIYIEEHYNW